MSGFFSKVMNTGVKAKLQGECAMLDREIKGRKQKFGIDLYDLVRKQEKEAPVKNMSGYFKGNIKEHWERVRSDILELERKKDALQVERTHEEVSRERGAPAFTAQERMQKAGSFVTSTGKETKIMAQIHMVDRDITNRKRQFGIDVFEAATTALEKIAAGGGGLKGGMKSALSKGLQKVSTHERDILMCVERAGKDVNDMVRRKQTRLREIDSLEEEGGAWSFGNNNRAEV